MTRPASPRLRLARFGFTDSVAAAKLLGSAPDGLGLWDEAESAPTHPDAGAVLTALGDSADPDLALRQLHRVDEAARRASSADGPLASNAPFGRRDSPSSGASAQFAAGTVESSSTTSSTGVYPDRAEKVSMFAVWSSVRRASAASPFRGGDITAIMGGGQLDLRLATIPSGEEAVIDIVAVMGGVEIIVPPTWEVSTPIMPFMGGVEDKRFPLLPTDPNVTRRETGGRLVLRGLVMMGGVHIKT